MDKAAIVERVAIQVHGKYAHLVRGRMEDTEAILTAAGHFDLLAERDALRKVAEVARTTHEAYINYTAAHEPDREIYRWQEFDRAMRELGEALNALGGGK